MTSKAINETERTSRPATPPDLSIIVPVFCEEAAIEPFLERMRDTLATLDLEWEILFINDGSRDNTLKVIRDAHTRDSRVKAIDLSRNFGKEVALCAGLDHAAGRATVPIDVDLQDPPELIPRMVELWREGYDVVQARRVDRRSDGLAKRTSASLFYSLINWLSPIPIPANVGDFRLLDRKVVDALRQYRERERFMKGIFASVGFRRSTVDYVRPQRKHGSTKFSIISLAQLSIQGITSFSALPLKIWTYIGVIVALSGLSYAAFITLHTMITGVDVPGYASIVVFVLLLNGLTLIGLGVQGEYVARIFSEVKARPLYIVREQIGEQLTPEASPFS